jgi:hypothetical protein
MRKSHIEQLMGYYEMLLNVNLGQQMKDRFVKFVTLLNNSIGVIANLDSQQVSGGMINSTIAEIQTLLLYLRSGMKTYQIAEEFGKQLHKCNLNVPCSVLPHANEVICIDLPDWFNMGNKSAWPESDTLPSWVRINLQKELDISHTTPHVYYKTAYVEQHDTVDSKGYKYRMLRFVLPDYDKEGKLLTTSTFANVDIGQDRTFDEALDDYNFKNQYDIDRDILHFVVKCYLYIKSGDPDLRHQKAPIIPLTKKPKKLKRFYMDHKDIPFIDVTLVGFNHLKEAIYTKDQTMVRGHYVWQRCGVGLSQIKLIWRKEHVRHFNTEEV